MEAIRPNPCCFAAGLILAFAAALPITALGQSTAAPTAVSADGRWLLTVNPRRELVRQSIDDPQQIERLPLRGFAKTIAASRTGKRVAFVQTDGMLWAAAFDSRGGHPTTHVDADPLTKDWPAADDGIDCPADPAMQKPGWRSPLLAISADGDRHAVATRPIRVYGEGDFRRCLPVAKAEITGLRFLDRRRRLLVSQVSDDPGAGATSHAIWDVESGRLLDLKFGPASFAGAERLAPRYDETQRALIVPAGAMASDDATSDVPRHRAQRIDLTHCGASGDRPGELHLSAEEWRTATFDPLGRWLATIAPGKDAAQRVVVRDAERGAVLDEHALPWSAPALIAGARGPLVLSSGRPGNGEATAGFLLGDGRRRAISLPVPALPATKPPPWPEAPCRLDDETPGARHLRAAEADGTYRKWTTIIDGSGRWRVLDDGSLAIDRGKNIDWQDAVSGRNFRVLPVPPGAANKRLLWAAGEQFIVWRGDTLSRVPFVAPGTRPRTLPFARKAGWTVAGVDVAGQCLRVRWATADCRAGKDCDGAATQESFHDLAGKVIREPGPRCTANAEAANQWSNSFFGSVRARHSGPEGQRTVFWVGLDAVAPADPDDEAAREIDARALRKWRSIPSGERKFAPLGDGRVAAVYDRNGFQVFDALDRALLASEAVGTITGVGWSPATATLLVEARDPATRIYELIGYHIAGVSSDTPASAARRSRTP